MATIPHEPSRIERPSWSMQLLVPELWTTLAIVVIWLSVLFAAVYGPNLENTTAGGDHSSVPSAIPMALFAFLATWVVARYGYGHNRRRSE
jgi:uncharacterized membrane protein (DUF485 family)